MPYFFKVSDYLDGTDEQKARWLGTVGLAISHLMVGCQLRYQPRPDEEDIVVFIIEADDIGPHPKGYEFEYYEVLGISETNILEDKIFFSLRETHQVGLHQNNRLIAFLERIRVNNAENYADLYIHITCRGSEASILANGLSAESKISPEDRIGDRRDRNDGMHLSKYLKYKTKYLELKNKLRASARELLKK